MKHLKILNREPTICVKCKWHIETSPRPKPGIWYNQKCTNPVFGQIKPDYVTGQYDVEDLPFCRDRNRDGNCPGYEEK